MALERLKEIEDMFQSVDAQMRLEFLLDYAKKLPPLPQRFAEARDAGLNRVPECMTPVFMFTECDEDGRMHFYIDVAEESPTVKGLMSIVKQACEDAPAEEVKDLPLDLMKRLALHECIGAQRTMGFGAILQRIRKTAAAAMAARQ